MHASLSLLTGVLLLFSRHVLAAPSDDRGVGERPPGQQAAGVMLHDMHHIDVYGRQIQKRQVGSWAQSKYLGDGTQSPAGVEAPEDDTQSPATPANEQVGAPNEEPTAPAKTEPSKEEEPKPDDKTHENKHDKKDKVDLSCTEDNGEQKCASVLGAKCGGGRQRALCVEGECTCGSPGPDSGTSPFPAKVECNHMAENRYLPRDPLVSAVNWFCEDADGRGHDKDSGSIKRTYYGNKDKPGTADKVNIGLLLRFLISQVFFTLQGIY
ncbi:hypothetical protein IMZ48_08020 [Candidatus Bathyarchaeota archaeon]|nr:hypothetical protein [Candidatus Bathyarchaeota archaeon]